MEFKTGDGVADEVLSEVDAGAAAPIKDEKAVAMKTSDAGSDALIAAKAGEALAGATAAQAVGDRVHVDDADRPDAGGGEVLDDRAADAARADDEHPRRAELLLTLRADFFEEDVAQIALARVGIEHRGAYHHPHNRPAIDSAIMVAPVVMKPMPRPLFIGWVRRTINPPATDRNPIRITALRNPPGNASQLIASLPSSARPQTPVDPNPPVPRAVSSSASASAKAAWKTGAITT